MQDVCICFLVAYCELAEAGLPRIFTQSGSIWDSVFVGT